MRTVAVATSSRADYSSCRPLLRALAADPALSPRVLVCGTHLVAQWGMTVDEVEADRIAPVERLAAFAATTPVDAAESVGLAAEAFGASFERERPDLVIVVGDRIELIGIATAALPFLVPVAHISGGDATGGATDDLVRHAVSKLAHLHLVAMPAHAARLESMGEAPWRIHVTGDPALDDIRGPWPDSATLATELGTSLDPPIGVVGFHPATLSGVRPATEAAELLSALDRFPGTLVFTYPGADPGAEEIVALLERFTARHPRAMLRASLGQRLYYGLLASADVLIGNTSSGIWEAPSFELPVVNVGSRQAGRVRARNVIDVPAEEHAIAEAIALALDPGFRRALQGIENPYGDGQASERIAAVLRDVELDHRLLAKWAEPVESAGETVEQEVRRTL